MSTPPVTSEPRIFIRVERTINDRVVASEKEISLDLWLARRNKVSGFLLDQVIIDAMADLAWRPSA